MPEVSSTAKAPMLSGIIGTTLGIAGVLGPIIGGAITDHSKGFPKWIFLLNVPAGGVIIALLFLVLPRNVYGFPPRVSWRTFDFIGSILGLGATVMLVFALEQGGAQVFPWRSATIIGTLTASGICAIGALIWSWYLSTKPEWAVKPLFPARLFTKRVMCVGIM